MANAEKKFSHLFWALATATAATIAGNLALRWIEKKYTYPSDDSDESETDNESNDEDTD